MTKFLLPLILALLPFCTPDAFAEVFLAQDEAMKVAFPDVERIERRNFVLSEEQISKIEAQAKAKLETKIVTFFEGHNGSQITGYAFIDSHTVRTHQETFMIVLSPQGEIRKTVILAFHEPPEYLASERWLKQFDGLSNPDSIQIGERIHGIVGSTLTTNAISSGARITLALFRELIASNPKGEN